MAGAWKPYLLQLFFSKNYVYASVLHKSHPSDVGHYVASASSREREVRISLQAAQHSTRDCSACQAVGTRLATRMSALQLPEVHFTPTPTQKYHGKVKALLDALQQNGVKLK